MRDATRWTGIVGAIVVAALGLWLGSRASSSRASEPSYTSQADGQAPELRSTLQSVEVVRPERLKMARSLDVPATLEANELVDVFAKVSGYVSEVRVDIGDSIKEGDVLAFLDVPEMERELLEAKAHLFAKSAALKAAQTADLAAAEAKVAQARSVLEVARHEAERKRLDRGLTERTSRRREELFREKAITDEALDEARTQLETATADIIVADAKIAAAEADVRGAEATRAVAEAGVEMAKAQVHLAETQVDRIETLKAYARITAPFDGIVSRRMVDRGALVQSATSNRSGPLFPVQKIDSVRIFIDVPEKDVPWVKLGTAARVTPYALVGKPFEGHVARLALSLDAGTRTMRAEIDAENPRRELMHGMYAQVALEIDPHPNALTIPATALLAEGKQQIVYVVRDDMVVRTPVELGLDDGIRVEILDGLSDGDWIVTTGKGLVSPGVRVRAVPKGNGESDSPKHGAAQKGG